MSDLPDGLHDFLNANGWAGARIDPIPGDASFRRYFRVEGARGAAMLMYAPPATEDARPFLDVAQWLAANGHRAPAIYASDVATGWVLLEDFGDDRMRDWLDANPSAEYQAYETAIDALVSLHQSEPGPFAPYDMPTYQREVGLFTEWFCPEAGLEVDQAGFCDAWEAALKPMLPRQAPGVCVLRDYHAENIMLLSPDKRGNAVQGLIDFQDALVGHPAYDLVSLLQDARRDVAPDLERVMLDRYMEKAAPGEDFVGDYARLGAQRNTKIVGIFTRLWKRDGKARYLDLIPRVWEAMERDLQHPALKPVARWFDANIPSKLRQRKGALRA